MGTESVARQTKSINIKLFKKLAMVIGNTLFILLLSVLVVLVFFLLQSRMAGGVPTVAGHHLYVVLSGSMSPTFDAGSMVVVRPQEADEINVGDVITYREPGEDKLTTHRVVEVNDQGSLQFITKGDANETVDLEPVPAENIIGGVVFALPYAGHIADFAQTTTGLVTLVIVPGLLIIGFETRNLIHYAIELDRQKEKEKKAKQEGERNLQA